MNESAFVQGVQQTFDLFGTSRTYHCVRHRSPSALESTLDSVLALRGDWARIGADIWSAFLFETDQVKRDELCSTWNAIHNVIVHLVEGGPTETSSSASKQLTLFEAQGESQA